MESLRNRMSNIGYGYLSGFVNGQNYRFNTVVAPDHPYDQLCHIIRVNKLSQRFPGSVNVKFLFLLRFVWLIIVDRAVQPIYHARNDVADIRSEIIVWPVNVAGNNRCEYVTVFLVVRLVGDVNQSFRVAVAEIRRVRRSVVYLKMIHRSEHDCTITE